METIDKIHLKILERLQEYVYEDRSKLKGEKSYYRISIPYEKMKEILREEFMNTGNRSDKPKSL